MSHFLRTHPDNVWGLTGAATWLPTHLYSVNDIAIPTVPNGFVYVNFVGAFSGASEPVWPTTPGATVHDGSTTWTCYRSGQYIVAPSDFQDLDSKIFKAVNGDQGGAWAPAFQMNIGGSGINLQRVLGVDYGGSVTTQGSSFYGLGGGANDWPLFGAGHARSSRTILQSVMNAGGQKGGQWQPQLDTASIRSFAPTVAQTPTVQPTWYVSLRVHNGATLARVTFNFRVPTPRANRPQLLPKFRVIRADTSGNRVPLASIAQGASTDGYVSPPLPTDGAGWYAGGNAQQFVYTCDQNNVIDTSLYTYFAQVIEEQAVVTYPPAYDGAVLFEQKLDVALATTPGFFGTPHGIYNVDGTNTTTGMRVLVKDIAAFWSGIWIANSAGDWTRAPDLSQQTDFSPFFFVRVSGGNVNANTYWECTYPQSSQSVVLSTSQAGVPPNPTSLAFQRRTARGNIYHSIQTDFINIRNMRFQ